MYECSDEASDDWYWLYAAVAFDDIPMKVISNDRTRQESDRPKYSIFDM